MALYRYGEHTPQILEGAYIAPSADVIGQVVIGKNASIWHQVVARGDLTEIVIGENTNIQDLSMLHVISQQGLYIGKNVSVGHKATLHACIIGDSCLIGMDAVVLDGAVIGENSVVAAGSVVPPGKKYPPGVMIMGSPAQVVRPLRAEEKERYANHYLSYIEAKNNFLDSKMVERIDEL